MKEATTQKDNPSCPSTCPGCSRLIDKLQERLSDPDQLKGWSLACVCTAAFIFPIILAIIGAVISKRSGAPEALGAITGLLAGVVIGFFVDRRFKRRRSKEQE